MNKDQLRRLKYIVCGAILIGLLGTSVLVMKILDIKYICPIKEFTNFDCPGCGGTRMVLSILQGDFEQAFRYNPFMFITIIPIIIVAIHQSIKFIKIGDFSAWLDKLLVTYAIALLTFGIIRNFEIFSWLKPTIIH